MAKVVKKVKNAALFDDGTIRVSNVRFSHPHLDRPYKKEGDQGVAKYGVVAMLPMDTHAAAHKLLEGEIERVLKENKLKALASDKKFLRDGNDSGKEEYADHWTLSAREERRPICKQTMDDGELELVEPEDAKEVFYGGAWGSILIEPWFQNNKHGKRVNASLRAITKKADDEAFGQGRISEEDADAAFEDDDDFDGPPSRSTSKSKSSSKSSRSRYEEDDDGDDPDDI